MTIRPINKKVAQGIIESNHYSLSSPIILQAFGVFEKEEIIGICCFGPSARGFNDSQWKVLELNRLVLLKKQKNLASQLISESIKQMPKGILFVSYSDKNWNHHGYIYQATNWIYTGSISREMFIINGTKTHCRTVNNKYGTSSIPKLRKMGLDVEKTQSDEKHRYFLIHASSKKQRKEILRWIDFNFPILPYPKGKNDNYNIVDVIKDKNKNRKKGLFD